MSSSRQLRPETILYGPRRPRTRILPRLLSWFAAEPLTILDGPGNPRGSDDLFDFYFRNRFLEMSPEYPVDLPASMESIGRSSYAYGHDGQHYMAWRSGRDSLIGSLDLESNTYSSSHLDGNTVLGPIALPANDGVIAVWVRRRDGRNYLRRVEIADDYRVVTSGALDLSDGPAVALTSTICSEGHPWVAWASEDRRSGLWHIRAGRVDQRDPTMVTISKTETRPASVQLRVVDGRPVILYQLDDSQTLLYGDLALGEEGLEIGSSSHHPVWEVLPSNEIVVSWIDALVSDHLLIASIDGNDPGQARSVIQSTGQVSDINKRLVIGVDPTGSARICWRTKGFETPLSPWSGKRLEVRSRIYSVEYRDGEARGPKVIASSGSGRIHLFAPLSMPDRMVLPLIEDMSLPGSGLMGLALR